MANNCKVWICEYRPIGHMCYFSSPMRVFKIIWAEKDCICTGENLAHLLCIVICLFTSGSSLLAFLASETNCRFYTLIYIYGNISLQFYVRVDDRDI